MRKVLGLFALLAVSNLAGAVQLTLVADNTRSSSGTLSYQVFKTCTPPSNVAGTGCSTFGSAWQVAHGVTGSTATWAWDGAALTATGMFQSTSHLSSNPAGSALISDKSVNLTINTATMTTTATSYTCSEGGFFANIGTQGCANTLTGGNFANESSVAYNVGGDATCVTRTIGGDDSSGGNVRGLVSRAAGSGCDATDGAYDLWTVVSDNTATGGQLILSNGIDITAPGTHYMTFQAVVPPVELTLVADNTRSSSGTLSYQVFKTCTPPSNTTGTGCSTFATAWEVANGVTGSTATWAWDGTTLAATGTFQSTSHLSSKPTASAIISDKSVNLTINTATMTTTAASYHCIEGNFLINVGAQGCANTLTGNDFANNSSVAYNVGGDATCANRTIGGDDSSGGNVRGLVSRAAGGGCDATDGAYDLWTVVSDNTATGGQLIISNGIAITAAGTHYMTFQAVATAEAVDDGPVNVLEATPAPIVVGANDTGFTGPVTVTVITNPTKGIATVTSAPGAAAGQTITYTSNVGATGTDTFVYSMTDGVNTDTATVTVNILPFGANNDAVATTRGVSPAPIAVGANDVGFGNTVNVTIANGGVCDQGGTAAVTAGQGGPPAGIRVTYTPATTAPGSAGYTETCSYTIDDGVAPADTANIVITVTNSVPVANDGNASALSTQGVAPAGRTATFTSPGTGGSLGNAGVTTSGNGTKGTTSVAGNVITYTVTDAAFFVGSDTFIYTVTDADGAASDEVDTGTVTVTIADVSPVIADGAITTDADTASAAFSPTITAGNGSAAQHTLAVTTDGAHGSCTLSAANATGTVTYTPDAGYTGADSCVLTLTDGDGDADTATINVTVNPRARARDDSATVSSGMPLVINVRANDLGFNSGAALGIYTSPLHGTAIVGGAVGSQTITYTSHAGYYGVDTFEYSIDDGVWLDTALVTVTVVPAVVDEDLDGVDDSVDNCLGAANPGQQDGDGDGFGNWCDADFNNDGRVNFADLAEFRSKFGSTDANTNLDSIGVVNFADLARFKALFGKPPGPSALVP